MPTPDDSTANGPVFEIDLIGMLRRRAKHIVLGTIVGVIAALGYNYSATPLYESSVSILVGQRSSEMTMRGTNNDSYASGASIQDDILATHIDILNSDKILEDAIVRGDLLNRIPSIARAKRNGERPVILLYKNLKVSRGGSTARKDANVISATYSGEDPEEAAIVIGAIFESYQAFVKKFSRGQTDEAAELITSEQSKLEKEVVEAEKEYHKFVSETPVFVEDGQVKEMHRERLAFLEAELNTLRTSIAETKAREGMVVSYMKDKSLEEVSDLERLALLSEKEVQRLKFFLDITRGKNEKSDAFAASMPVRNQISEVEVSKKLELYQKQRQLAEEYGPNHPSVLNVMQELAVIEDFLEENEPEVVLEDEFKTLTASEMLEAYQQLLQNDLQDFERREKVLLEQSAEEMKLAKAVESEFMKGSALKDRLERAKSRYNEVFARLQELNLTGDYAGFSTELLAEPVAPTEASWPKLPLSLAVGLLLGGLLGLSTGVIAEFADSTFRDAKDLEKSVGAIVLTHVGRFDLAKLRQATNPNSKLAPQLVAFHAPRSVESEVYRNARTSLLLASKRNKDKVFMMTSPAPGDGKSTTVANLAISLAQAGKKVLLVDSDLRRPMVCNLFGMSEHAGVADIVLYDHPLADAIQESEQENLHLLTHGTRTSAPSELFESFEFSKLLEDARRRYDIIFIDAPPVLAVTDPTIVATLSDSTLMTVQVTKNNRKPVERAAEILRAAGVQVSGIIVNQSDSKTTGYGYSHEKYGYGYGYEGMYYDNYSAPDAPESGKRQKPAILIGR
jgi:polysaccharide biosynthesis transport protein